MHAPKGKNFQINGLDCLFERRSFKCSKTSETINIFDLNLAYSSKCIFQTKYFADTGQLHILYWIRKQLNRANFGPLIFDLKFWFGWPGTKKDNQKPVPCDWWLRWHVCGWGSGWGNRRHPLLARFLEQHFRTRVEGRWRAWARGRGWGRLRNRHRLAPLGCQHIVGRGQ